jgi:3-dehydroquinate synthase
MSESKNIRLEGNGYCVFIGEIFSELNNWLKEKNYSSLFIVTDLNVYDHCLSIIQQNVPALAKAAVIPILPGESHKTTISVQIIWQMLIEHEADKKALLINLGGGLITDMGGFAAATYKRGIDFINVPTTLLAMIDASIGGKTGVDFDNIKNAVGVIKNPEAVFVHSAFLHTLPHDQLVSGLAEMIKHGLIAGEDLLLPLLMFSSTILGELTTIPANAATVNIMSESIGVKLNIVSKDPEEKNIRKQLNFGHTFGHALESWLLQKQQPVLHGICVAAGMIVALQLSEKLAGLDAIEKEKLVGHIKHLFPPILFREDDIDYIIGFMKQDKKNSSGEIRFVLMKEPGVMLVDQLVNEDEIKEGLKYYLSETQQ